MNYYRDQITDKSWQVLTELQRELKMVLIGGWAVWVYTRQLKSKDIDVVLDFDQLEILRKDYDVIKNERLRKYEARKGEIQIDVYVPYYSQLGIGAEKVMEMVTTREGFTVPIIEVLLILKLAVYRQRKNSVKGRKDLIDVVSLLLGGEASWQKWQGLLNEYGLFDLQGELISLLVPLMAMEELGLNRHQLARKKKEWLGAMKADG